MREKRYYYEVTDINGIVFYVEINARPKSPEMLCEFFHIEGTAREISKQEYLESTKEEIK